MPTVLLSWLLSLAVVDQGMQNGFILNILTLRFVILDNECTCG